jgi:Ni/Co efflux regulator RcnB
MNKTRILRAIVGGAMVAVTAVPTTFAAPQEKREGVKHEYHFRQEDAAKLKEHYKGRAKVDWDHREHWAAGGRLTGDWRKHLEPVPAALIRELPPIPAGCAIGYIDGYCVVYDPGTFEIVDVIDLQ